MEGYIQLIPLSCSRVGKKAVSGKTVLFCYIFLYLLMNDLFTARFIFCNLNVPPYLVDLLCFCCEFVKTLANWSPNANVFYYIEFEIKSNLSIIFFSYSESDKQ